MAPPRVSVVQPVARDPIAFAEQATTLFTVGSSEWATRIVSKEVLMSKTRKGEAVLADASLKQAKRSSPLFKSLLTSQHGSPGHDHGPSIREDHHKGHHIVIKTTYEVTVDGKTFTAPLGVSNGGMVQYHGIPNIGFPSAIDLIKCIIDQFPEDFPPRTPAAPHKPHVHGLHRSAVARRASVKRK